MMLNKRKGVTYLELITVLVIIAVVAGGMVVMMGAFNSTQELEASAANLIADLRLAQQLARTQKDEYLYYGVRFFAGLGDQNDRQGWRVMLFCQPGVGACNGWGTVNPCGGNPTLPIVDINCIIVKSSVLADYAAGCPIEFSPENTFFSQGVTLDAASGFQVTPVGTQLRSIIFNSLGSATVDGVQLLGINNLNIILTRNGRVRTITIVPLTGHITLQ